MSADLTDPAVRERLRAEGTRRPLATLHQVIIEDMPNPARALAALDTIDAQLSASWSAQDSALDLIDKLIAREEQARAAYHEQWTSAKEMWDEAGLKVGERLPNDSPRNHFILGMFSVLDQWQQSLSRLEQENA